MSMRLAGPRVSELARAAEGQQAGQPGARETLIKRLRGLVELYPGHIWKEDYLLFPMTEKVLNQGEMARLLRHFDQVKQALGADVHARVISMAERLAQICTFPPAAVGSQATRADGAPAASSCEPNVRAPNPFDGG